MLVLSAPAGRWAQVHGARIPMTLGPLLAALGLVLLLRIGPDTTYLTDVLPGVVVFGLGLSVLVAPLTGAVLGAVPPSEAGIASGVNNAVARTAQLLEFDRGFGVAMWICVGLLVAGALIAAVLLRTPRRAATLDNVDCMPQCGMAGPALAPLHKTE
jgi:hypothetical protein